MTFSENLKEGLINGLIGSVPVFFFIGVATFAFQCANSQSNKETIQSVKE